MLLPDDYYRHRNIPYLESHKKGKKKLFDLVSRRIASLTLSFILM